MARLTLAHGQRPRCGNRGLCPGAPKDGGSPPQREGDLDGPWESGNWKRSPQRESPSLEGLGTEIGIQSGRRWLRETFKPRLLTCLG